MLRKSLFVVAVMTLVCLGGLLVLPPAARALNTSGDYEAVPPFLTAGVAPLVMLVMGRNHKLYYEAYNDASDLNGDGTLDIRYDPTIDYYGYFDPYKCYKYSTGSSYFYPVSVNTDKTCNKSGTAYDFTMGEWSGNFLNYLTMSRMDTVRKVLYGGKRSYDGTETASSSVILERVFIPQDAHSWGKEYDKDKSGISIASVAPMPEPTVAKPRHLFASTTLTSATSNPLLRTITTTDKRIWDWVSKERPVADNSLGGLGSVAYNSSPNNHEEFENMVGIFAIEQNRYGSGIPRYWYDNTYFGIDEAWGNPWTDIPAKNSLSPNYYGSSTAADQENYLTIFSGVTGPARMVVQNSGVYWFAVDSDDASEFIITGVTQVVSGNELGPSRVVVSAWYGPHPNCGGEADGDLGSLSASCTENLG
ncbi:MAG: hypothetical protein JXL84_04150, partial [Deltaproteobacteria bacterium]|nr:hypothetical protein [Deltaproteobacteria bacterium]